MGLPFEFLLRRDPLLLCTQYPVNLIITEDTTQNYKRPGAFQQSSTNCVGVVAYLLSATMPLYGNTYCSKCVFITLAGVSELPRCGGAHVKRIICYFFFIRFFAVSEKTAFLDVTKGADN